MTARRTYARGSRTKSPTPPEVVVDLKDDDGNWKRYHFSVADAGELVDKVHQARETAWKNAWRATPKEKKELARVADGLVKAGKKVLIESLKRRR